MPADARCGFLVVPENRAEPDGRTIDLTVGIVPAASPHPAPDPVVYLAGGPGGFPLGEAQLLIAAGFNRDRELIILSKRGTLYGPPNPAQVCPEVDKAFTATLALPLDGSQAIALNVAATRASYQRLVAAGPTSARTTRPRTRLTSRICGWCSGSASGTCSASPTARTSR